jgi:hypothetical protein
LEEESDMQESYWFLEKAKYESLLDDFATTEDEYLTSMNEIAQLFPKDRVTKEYQATLTQLGNLDHFDLVPAPNQRLRYNPVPILLGGPLTVHCLAALLYLGMALRDAKTAFGPTKAFRDLTSKVSYRGALFEIEVGAELARSNLKPRYRRGSPDFVLKDLPLGVEAAMRDVPLDRYVAERLFATLAFLDFRHLSIELRIRGEYDPEELVGEIATQVEQLLETGGAEVDRTNYHIRRVSTRPGESTVPPDARTLAVSFGGYRYEDTLSHFISERLKEKERQIAKRFVKDAGPKCVVALDTRSLLAPPIEPESDYERRMAERHRAYYDRLRLFGDQVIAACQAFTAQSPLVKGVLLWGRKRTRTLADEVHRRNSIRLATPERVREVDRKNLSSELSSLVENTKTAE